MDQDPGRFFTAKAFGPGERDAIPLEKLREIIFEKMKEGMNEKEMQYFLDFIMD